jgi:hypothetical protein
MRWFLIRLLLTHGERSMLYDACEEHERTLQGAHHIAVQQSDMERIGWRHVEWSLARATKNRLYYGQYDR